MSKFINQSGSALLYTMFGLSILIGTSFVMLQKSRDTKIAEGELAKLQSMRLVRKKIATVLTDPATCTKNFEGMTPGLNSSFGELKDMNGNILYEYQKYYYGNAIQFGKFRLLPHPTTPAERFILEIDLRKSHAQNQAAQNQVYSLELEAIYQGTQIKSCAYKGGAPMDINAIIASLCSGPGMISNSDGHCVIANPDPGVAKECPVGQAVTSVTLVNNQLQTNCNKLILQPGNCEFGVKYTGEAGKYTCLTLSEIVNSAEVQTTTGASCYVDVEAGKFIFKCNAGAGP